MYVCIFILPETPLCGCVEEDGEVGSRLAQPRLLKVAEDDLARPILHLQPLLTRLTLLLGYQTPVLIQPDQYVSYRYTKEKKLIDCLLA